MGGIAPPAGFGGFGEEHRALAAALPAPAAALAAPVPNMEMAGASVAAHVSPHIFPVLEAETGSKAPSPPENNQVALHSRFVLQRVALSAPNRSFNFTILAFQQILILAISGL